MLPNNCSAEVPSTATSQAAKTMSKYSNRDRSKVITVPKNSASDLTEPPPETLAAPSAHPSTRTNDAPQTVNRKKQKRREKAAAKKAQAAATEAPPDPSSQPPQPRSVSNGPGPKPPVSRTNGQQGRVAENGDIAEGALSSPRRGPSTVNGLSQPALDPDPQRMKPDKKKKYPSTTSNGQASSEYSGHAKSDALLARPSNGRIWDNSSTEERDRIKQFWLNLREDERRALVQIEKAAVLKKMKEQQKQTCSCTVCGRKRTAIEEELEGLYDAYYRELEHYATQPAQPGVTPAGRFGPMSGLPHPHGAASMHGYSRPASRSVEVDEDDPEEEDDGAYSDEADDGHGYSDEDPGDDDPSEIYSAQSFATNFLNFGNNLTVQGGILTVADDLLQNDGRKFIEMMEQLAERRMQREQESHGHYHTEHHHHHHSHHDHGHLGPNPYHNHQVEEEEDYEDEDEACEEFEDEVDDEGEYSQDDDFEEDEMEDPMTESQRMEEGRRMFQIFAARMFEQRVLKAYRESVSKERAGQFLLELEQEQMKEAEAKEAKAQATQRRKEKEKEKKRLKAEEKRRKEEQKQAELEAQKAEKERQAQEQRLKLEEKRRQKEAKKKADEEERLRKEAERQRRLHEQKEKEERKAREAREARETRERERKRKEEQEVQEKAQREKEVRDRKEQQEKAEKARKDKAASKDKNLKENRKPKQDDNKSVQKAPASSAPVAIPLGPKQRSQQNQTPVATPLQSRAVPAKFTNSPVVPVAIPSLKLGKGVRPRVLSQQQEDFSSFYQHSQSQNTSPHPVTPAQSSPGPIRIPGARTGSGQSVGRPPGLAMSPQHSISIPSGQQLPFSIPPTGMSFPPGFQQPMLPPPGLIHPASGFPPIAGGFRPTPGLGAGPPPAGIPMGPPPGLASPIRALFAPPGLGGSMDGPALSQIFGPPGDGSPSTHSRQASSGFEQSPSAPAHVHTQPVNRPAPIGRPCSVIPGQRAASGPRALSQTTEPDDSNQHLGSKALLGEDEPDQVPAPSAARPGQFPPPASRSLFADPFTNSSFPLPLGWNSNFTNPFAPSGLPSGGWPSSTGGTFGGPIQPVRGAQSRQVRARLQLCDACRQLGVSLDSLGNSEGFLDLDTVVRESGVMEGPEPITLAELEILLSTEGSRNNGGGVFDVTNEPECKRRVRFTEDAGYISVHGAVGAPGTGIGSPTIGGATANR